MARPASDPPSTTARLQRWLLALAAPALLWLGGAAAYVDRVEQIMPPVEGSTDAIVVLTGGAARLSTGLRLLDRAPEGRLLVSGVSETATKASLAQAVLPAMPDAVQASAGGQGIDLQLLFECCVDLGFEAGDTAGNAAEAASWAAARGFARVRLVTANYHMPRALVEFGRMAPGLTVLPHPVRSDAMRVEDWWQRRTATAFLLGEYSKYLVALLRARLAAALAETVTAERGS